MELTKKQERESNVGTVKKIGRSLRRSYYHTRTLSLKSKYYGFRKKLGGVNLQQNLGCPRTYINIRKGLNVLPLNNFCTMDLTLVKLNDW